MCIVVQTCARSSSNFPNNPHRVSGHASRMRYSRRIWYCWNYHGAFGAFFFRSVSLSALNMCWMCLMSLNRTGSKSCYHIHIKLIRHTTHIHSIRAGPLLLLLQLSRNCAVSNWVDGRIVPLSRLISAQCINLVKQIFGMSLSELCRVVFCILEIAIVKLF